MRRTPLHLLLALLAALALLLGSCSDGGSDSSNATATSDGGDADDGSDDDDSDDDDADDADDDDSDEGGGGSVEEFCEFLRESEDSEIDINEDPEAAAEAMETMRELAPEEIREDIEVLLDVMEQLAELDEDDPDAMGAVFGLFFQPDVMAAAENLEDFGVDECGLEPTENDFTDPDFGGETVTTDGFDFDFDEGDDDTDDPFSIDAMQAYLDDEYGDEPWIDKIASWSIFGDEVEVAPFGEELTEDEAFAICDALLEYLESIDSDAQLTVTDEDGEGIVMRGRDDPACTHA
jgi:hypothetical protein